MPTFDTIKVSNIFWSDFATCNNIYENSQHRKQISSKTLKTQLFSSDPFIASRAELDVLI